jgi:hypothetical protein
MKIFEFFSLVAISIAIAAPLTNGVSASVPQFTLQPASVSTDMGETAPARHMIDQSGLSPRYTHLVSDFDSFIASNPTADHQSGLALWGSQVNVRTGNLDFDLGGQYIVGAMALWNLGPGDPSSLHHFNIWVDDNSSFSSPEKVDEFTASNSLGTANAAGAQVFTFAPISASFVRIEVIDTWDPSSFGVALNEVMFATPVPEPPTYAMLLAGLGLVGFIGRRRKSSPK